MNHDNLNNTDRGHEPQSTFCASGLVIRPDMDDETHDSLPIRHVSYRALRPFQVDFLE